MEQDDDPLVVFRSNIEANLTEKHEEISKNYKEVIRGLELENMSMRRRLALQ
jgi:uncharacterized protein (UPF0254 family)